jgi:hypothetical protein
MTTALDRAIADITRHFTPPMNLKRRVRVLIRGDRYVIECRYQNLIEGAVVWHKYSACSLDEAVILVQRYLAAELYKRQVAFRLWRRYSGTNTRLIYLQDAMLILRWLRRHRPLMWPRLRDDLLEGETMREAAE